MGSKVGIIIVVIIMGVSYGGANFEQDRAECADKLVGLATCISYVGGTAKAPTMDCCTGLKQVLEQSMKCLCILIKDRDNPNLGFKVNATLAATLPSTCKAPANITHCIDLLDLPPSSPDAKFFSGFGNLTHITPPTGNNTSAEVRSDGGMKKTRGWVGDEMITCGFVILWLLASF